MTILGIDTSSTDLSVSLRVNGSTVAAINRYIRNSHAEHITQAVKLALELGGTSAEQVGHVAVSIGPGSFTGIRIGLSFVKGFCLMAKRKVMPLSSLHVLTHAVLAHTVGSGGCPTVSGGCPTGSGGDRRPQKIFAALDARQDRIHWGSFTMDDKLRRLSDDRLSSPDELLARITPDDVLITDTVGYSRSTVFDMFKGKAEIIDATRLTLCRADSCTALAAGEVYNEDLWKTAGEVVPGYLQMSAAQEKLCG